MKLLVKTYQIRISDIDVSTIKCVPVEKGWVIFHSDGNAQVMTKEQFGIYVNEVGYNLIRVNEV